MTALSDDQLLRYARNILLDKVDIEGQAKLMASHVAVVGAGGLGAPVLQYLAASGIGQLTVIDDDVVDATNLQRQVIHDMSQVGRSKVESVANFVSRLNPDVVVHQKNCKLDQTNAAELLLGVDLVVIGTDNFSSRYVVNEICRAHKINLVTGAAIGSSGQLTSFHFSEHSSPCFQCVYPLAQDEQLTCATAGVFGPVVGTIGSAMAMEAMKILLGIGTPLFGRLLIWDALAMQWQNFNYQAQSSCTCCAPNGEQA